jgi:hypothetical protein
MFLILAAGNLSACAMYSGTGYRARTPGEGEGFLVKPIDEGGYSSSYIGDAFTPREDALAYTMLAAYSFCAAEKKVAYVPTPTDLTTTATGTAIGVTTVPVYNSNGTTSYTTQNYAYPVSRTYPAFITPFLCQARYQSFENSVQFEAIGRELVHPTTKDFKGGLLLKAPSEAAGGTFAMGPFRVNDVIVRVGNQRVEQVGELQDALSMAPAGPQEMKIEVIRRERIVKLNAKVRDITAEIVKVASSTIKILCAHLPPQDSEFPSRPAICTNTP